MLMPTRLSSTAAPRDFGSRILVLLQDGDAVDSAHALAALKREGWSVLSFSQTADSDNAAAELLALVQAGLDKAGSSPSPVFVCGCGTAALAIRTLTLWHRRGVLPRACGLVTIDAADLSLEPLAEIETLAWMIAANREAAAARHTGFACHHALQARDRDSRFIVMNAARTLADEITDATGQFGRELRWLLYPVHSRSAPTAC